MKKGCPYGTHRVVSPKGVLPQPADVVDNNMDEIYDNAPFHYSLELSAHSTDLHIGLNHPPHLMLPTESFHHY